MSRFLTDRLKLKVNEAKSAVGRPEERKVLGFSISNDGSERRIAPKALATFKARIRDMTPNVRPVLRPKQPCTTFFQGARKQGVANLAIPARDILVNNYVKSIS